MHTNFTYKKFGSYCKPFLSFALFLTILLSSTKAQTLLIDEGFNTFPPSGWSVNNLSTPIGSGVGSAWQTGVADFPAFDGTPLQYTFVGFRSVNGDATISNWLISPVVSIKNGDIVSFYTRTFTASAFPDRLECRLSTNGTSTNVGTTNATVGDFTNLLVTVNPTFPANAYPQAWTQYTAVVAGVTGTVTGRIAMRYFVTNGGPAGANSNGIGVDRVVYNSVATTPCTGTPAPGATIASIPTGCPGAAFTVSLTTPTPGLGVTYQWQSSPTLAGTYTNIAGAISATYSSTVTTGASYRCVVTCTGSGLSGTSTPVSVALTPPSGCYCTPTVINCNLDDRISNVTFGTLNNTSGTTCTNGYSNYTNTTPPTTVPDVIIGGANPISVTVGPGGTEFVGAWIDYNKNGIFEVAEFQLLGSGNGVTINSAINVPASALTGTTRMRLRVQFASPVLATQSCSQSSTFGEVEDYTVNLIPCIPITITTQPANATVLCGGNTTISVVAAGSIPNYQWQFRTSATAAWQTVSGAPYSGFNTNTLTITNANTSMNGYQYRVIYAGACTASDFSNAATLTVNPIVAVVNPVSATICQGGVQQLSITNIASPAPGSVTVNSSFATPIAIPDGNPAGINSVLPVTVPAGAVVTGVSVRMSGTHSWFGDLVMALRAPNGRIINLNYYLGVTGGPGASTVFTNTVISSTGTTSLATATSPFTGTFRADLVPAAGVGTNGSSGPTGFIPNEITWAPLITPNTAANASGNWTLAMYDGFTPDAGALANWSITINYVIGSPATGVYTGPAGTMFTDAAATIPYTGTAVNTVYVKPTTAGVNNYSVIVTDAACSSLPLTIPVTMYAPVTASTALTLANRTVCASTNTSFALGGTLGGGPLFNHQFQVRAAGATTWTNITNGGVYGGATTSTLTLTGVPASFNGNQYRDSIYTGNGCGFLISPVATLTVNPTPVVTISAAPITKLFPSLTTTLTAAVSPNAVQSYQWLRNGVAVAGATANKYVVTIDALGTYTVNVTDVNGCSNAGVSTPASITISDSVNKERLFIYPSPNAGQFQVRYYYDANDGTSTPGIINVYDSKGTRVFTRTYSPGSGYDAMRVDLGTHARGVYRVDFTNIAGERIKTGTVMVF